MARLYASVVARDTAATYKGKPIDPRQVARERARAPHRPRQPAPRGRPDRLNLALIEGEARMHAGPSPRRRASEPAAGAARARARIVRVLQPRSSVGGGPARRLVGAEISADELAMRAQALWFPQRAGRQHRRGAELLDARGRARSGFDPRLGRLAFWNLHGTLNGWLPDRAAALRRHRRGRGAAGALDSEGPYTYQTRAIQAFLRCDWPR